MNTRIASTTLPRVTAAAMFGALTLSFGAASFAADDSDVPKVIVKYGDLNLSNPKGAASLYSRIASAAHGVCRAFDADNRDFAAGKKVAACVHKAIANAVTDVGEPGLFAVYNAKNPQPRAIVVASAQAR
ncbi:MAG TPA: UrcA family protein [Steroidobacteraceae bacterium]|jgi:UrcA family protein